MYLLEYKYDDTLTKLRQYIMINDAHIWIIIKGILIYMINITVGLWTYLIIYISIYHICEYIRNILIL